VSRFQKIFLASALVVAGFAVAKFLGQPVVPRQVLAFERALIPATSTAIQSRSLDADSPHAAGRVQLLPDSPTTHASAPAMSPSNVPPEPPRLGNALSPIVAANDRVTDSTMPRTFDFGPISSAPISGAESSRARLRNEAPRPLGIDPQSPVAIRRLPTENVDVSDPYKVADTKTVPSAWSAPPLLNTGFTATTPSAPATLPASYVAPINSVAANPSANQLAPPPWPVPEENAEPRTHIVVDGDSLERLASRYLSDPRRSREIYELNRELLSSPDLLPIGAELKIPDRVVATMPDRRGFLPNSSNAKSANDVGREKMTQIQPAFSPQGIIPRAQLAPPITVQ
jgi:hypothetical protein